MIAIKMKEMPNKNRSTSCTVFVISTNTITKMASISAIRKEVMIFRTDNFSLKNFKVLSIPKTKKIKKNKDVIKVSL